jgi:hypothetical protein
MPITSGSNSFNIGRDTTLTLIGPFGLVTLVNVVDFQEQQETTQVGDTLLNGDRLNAELPAGWSGSFMVDRGSNDLDVLFGQIEAAWYNNGTVSSSTLYKRVVEVNGSTSNWQYVNVALKLTNGGNAKGDAITQQSVSWRAGRRLAV